MTAAEIAQRLQARPYKDGWVARCPAHDDRTPSLSINEGEDGRVLLYCHAGCSYEDILAALDLSSPPAPLTSHASTGGRPEAEYVYRDSQRRVVLTVTRKRLANGKKTFIRTPTGVEPSQVPVYRLPDLQGRTRVVIPEGEKDVDRLVALGIPATTNASGAGQWQSHHTRQLHEAGVRLAVVLPDNDSPGRAHMHAVAASLQAAGIEVRWCDLPGLPPKGDVSDALDAGLTKDALVAHLRDAPLYEAHEQGGAEACNDADEAPVAPRRVPWPSPLPPAAYRGVLGEITLALAPETEADPAGILVQLLVMLGNVLGRTAHFEVGPGRHYLNLFCVTVGRSGKGRKGMAHDQANRLFEAVDPEWATRCQTSGLSSGEGLIWAIRDVIHKTQPVKDKGRIVDYEQVIEDRGVTDKRLLVTETEFAGPLKCMAREGNTLSVVIRQAWDGKRLKTLTKASPATATDPHISIIGHITSEELRRDLNATEQANGFGNRFLWVCVQRSQLLPDGGRAVDLGAYVQRVRRAIEFGRSCGALQRDAQASARWHQVYPRLTAERPGMFGMMTGRGEPLVMRLACLYAICDSSPVVGLPHLEAALALWRYAEQSAAYLFGQALGDPVADEILRLLRDAAPEPLTRTAITAGLHRNRAASAISRALELLKEAHLATPERVPSGATGGRPVEQWRYTGDERDESDEQTSSAAPDALASRGPVVNERNEQTPSPALRAEVTSSISSHSSPVYAGAVEADVEVF